LRERLFLVKYGEIALKKRNRGAFVKALKDSIRAKLPDRPVSVYETWHRVYVRFQPEDRDAVAASLSRTFGIVAFCEALRVQTDMEAVEQAACDLAREYLAAGQGTRFKAEVRRAEKSYPLSSYQIACRLGEVLLQSFPELVVDVNTPDWVLTVEMREHAYLYGPESPAPGGLPTGSSGKGILLLSGGIDSPVAGWMMGKRGLAIEAAYFHSAPFTSEDARRKVESLARILSAWLPDLVLHVVPFTPMLARIREKAKDEETTLLMRACMMRVASVIAAQRGAACLVTGESLGQVASQTIESMAFTETSAGIPVLRPLVGMNKEEIITIARKIGTFDTSNLPFDDCCTLFSPARPLIHPSVGKMVRAYTALAVDELLEETLQNTEEVRPGAMPADMSRQPAGHP
jgi:tRNA uracil 4-sulfurtransferase